MRTPIQVLMLLASAATGAAQVAVAPRPDATFFVSSTGVYEDNFGHDRTGQRAYGGIIAAGLGIRDRSSRPRLEMSYEVALHRYNVTTPWDRVSHLGEAAITVRPARWLEWESSGDVSIRGSSDDRDLSDNYQVSQGLAFRIAPTIRLNLEGAWRLRRYHDGSGRDGNSRNLEAEFKRRALGAGWMTLGGKYEINRADSPRYRYHRMTYAFGLATASEAINRLDLELKYRVQQYEHRRIELGGRTPRRRDYRLAPSISYTHRFTSNLEVGLGYEYEHRSSNDVSKGYDAHRVSLKVLRRW